MANNQNQTSGHCRCKVSQLGHKKTTSTDSGCAHTFIGPKMQNTSRPVISKTCFQLAGAFFDVTDHFLQAHLLAEDKHPVCLCSRHKLLSKRVGDSAGCFSPPLQTINVSKNVSDHGEHRNPKCNENSTGPKQAAVSIPTYSTLFTELLHFALEKKLCDIFCRCPHSPVRSIVSDNARTHARVARVNLLRAFQGIHSSLHS